MPFISADTLIRFAKTLERKRLATMARSKGFTVAVVKAGIEITPASSGTPRTVAKSRIQLVCDEYNRSKSLKPGDYQTITLDASYLLALIKLQGDGQA
jgi:hypothetical protein